MEVKIRFGGRGSGHLQPKPSGSGGFERRLAGGRAEVAKAFCPPLLPSSLPSPPPSSLPTQEDGLFLAWHGQQQLSSRV